MFSVSVVIAARNEEHALGRCLDSVFRNRYERFNVIVVDDASSDATGTVATGYPSDRLVYVRESRHSGPAHCRNLGWRLSNADLIFFTDADCEVAPDWIEEGVRCLRRAGVIGVEGNTSSTTESRLLVHRTPINPFYETQGPWVNRPQQDFAASNIAFRRDVLETIDGFRANRYAFGREDSDLGWRASELGTITHCPTMRVAHSGEWWTFRSLIKNAQRYRSDVVFLKDHRFFFFRKGRVLHPKLLLMLIFPPAIAWFLRPRSPRDLLFLPGFVAYLLALRLNIWRAAIRERVFAL